MVISPQDAMKGWDKMTEQYIEKIDEFLSDITNSGKGLSLGPVPAYCKEQISHRYASVGWMVTWSLDRNGDPIVYFTVERQ